MYRPGFTPSPVMFEASRHCGLVKCDHVTRGLPHRAITCVEKHLRLTLRVLRLQHALINSLSCLMIDLLDFCLLAHYGSTFCDQNLIRAALTATIRLSVFYKNIRMHFIRFHR